MRSSDIVAQLAIKLPTFVDDFTSNFSVSSLVRLNNTVTVTTTADHGLLVGKAVNIVGALTPIVIESIDRVGIQATLVTASPHDFTETIGFENVIIEGANESEFNGTFPVLSVPTGVANRRTIRFQVADSGPIAATGSPLLLNGSNIFQGYNGLRLVTAVPSTTVFEYEITDTTLFSPASGAIFSKTSPRISSSVSFERILDAYTKQTVDNAWLFVVMGDGIAQKNRKINLDSTDNIQKTQFFDQRLTQTASLFLLLPTSSEIAARNARDRAEELLQAITKSILLSKFDTLFSNRFNNPLQFNEHGFQDYNGSFYVHRYTFEATIQMGFEDTVGADGDVAFRDICMTMGLDVGNETFDTNINLDVEPLFSPINLGNLVLWLDADDAGTITESSPKVVSQWADKSGKGNDAIQTIENRKPTTRIFGADINGKNSITFASVNSRLDISSSASIGGLWAVGGTVIFVTQSNSTGDSARFAETDTWTLLKTAEFVMFNVVFSGIDAIFSIPISALGFPTLPPSIITVQYNASSVTNTPSIYVDGTLIPVTVVTQPTGNYDVVAEFSTIGNRIPSTGAGFDGDFGEGLYYKSRLSDISRDKLESELGNKWGVTVSDTFAPDSIQDLVLWLDADDASTIAESADKVSQWGDKSTNGNDAIQTIQNRKPTTNVNAIGGKNTIIFAGVNSRMDIASSSTVGGLWATGGTAVFVSQSQTMGDQARFMETNTWMLEKNDEFDSISIIFQVEFSVGHGRFFIAVGEDFFTENFDPQPSIFTLTYDASSTTNVPIGYLNGVSVPVTIDQVPTGTYDSSSDLAIVGNRIVDTSAGFDGDFGEIILYKQIPEQPTRIELEKSLGAKWDIEI